MRLTKLEAENFLSFKKFELDLDNRGIILIEGKNSTNEKFQSNGAGKSSLLEPIIYALYDTTSKNIRADEVINRHVGKNTKVALEGYKGDDLYRIERYRKHSKHKNKVLLFCNGDDITGKSTSDTNETIEKLVGIDHRTFINSIMFSQGEGAGKFAIATDKEKKEILENLLNLNIYSQAQQVAKSKVTAKDSEIATQRSVIEKLEWELGQVDVLEEQDQQNYNSIKEAIAAAEANYETTLREFEAFVTSNIENLNVWQEEIETLTKTKDSMVVDTNTELNTRTEIVNSIQQELNQAKHRKSQLEYQKDDLANKYKKLSTNTNCPVCGNPLDTSHKEKEQLEIREQLKPILTELHYLNIDITKKEQAYADAHESYTQVKSKHDQLMSQYNQVVQDIHTRQQAINSYNNGKHSYESRLNGIKDNLANLRNMPQPKKRNKERNEIKSRIKSEREVAVRLEQEKLSLENVVKTFSNSGVKSHVLDLKTPFLNERGNKYLSMLSGSDMELNFTTQTRNKNGELSDKFDVQVINTSGGDNYKSNSGGEKKRADLSIALALQDLVLSRSESTFNIAVYDEVFDALDSVGAENVVTLLKERLSSLGTIFVITHNEHLKPLFDQVITVVKDRDGISTLTEGEKT
ncbi:putative recombination related exonuclease [Bacillus phage Bp8p-C]|uniref:Putative recombination related exonuclease n=2 Tax=Agatevirus Bp8pC TaxID=1910937 RepID=A0A0A0PJ70_9CAUD|nr:exonuclease [Bacillus phage Bp8p-C]YP_009784393.1 putative recombination related exonuclease [Bacillus phage Bp8p-T]AHJ87523.1 putative recombination related exonuclease [Bacillus phage Bp8p-C]AHJ87734.1 putative recombination related exonuclease [Bacillus phage Bp8p-T]